MSGGKSMAKGKILIIEDELSLARFVELELTFEGYEVTIADDGKKGLEAFEKQKYDLILLDLMLPGIEGKEICRRIRKVSNVPIIILTAKDEISDKVAGLDSGASDYITKPFAIEELLARMRAALRKVQTFDIKLNSLTFKDMVIDTDKRMVHIGSEAVELTKKEYELLLYLVKNKNIVLTREQIFNKVWGYDYLGETNVVDVYIRYLRAKIDERFGKRYIFTARGVGYYVSDEK